LNVNHVNLLSLRVFLLAADSGSLTRASAGANISLSSVSKRIAELEKILNCQLFVRLPRGLELTPAGHGLVRHARKLLDGMNTMASEMSDYVAGHVGHVRIAANFSAVIQFMPTYLAGFYQTHPGVRIHLEEALSEVVINAVDTGKCDIGIFADNVDATNIKTFNWHQDRLVLLVRADHPLAKVSSIWFADSLDWNFVALMQGSSLLRRVTDAAIDAGRILKVNVQVSSFDVVCRMIEAGMGIGVLPYGAITSVSLGSKLKAITLRDAWSARTLRIGIHNTQALSPGAQKMFDFLCTYNNAAQQN